MWYITRQYLSPYIASLTFTNDHFFGPTESLKVSPDIVTSGPQHEHLSGPNI